MSPSTLEDCRICEGLAMRDPYLAVLPAVHACALCHLPVCPLHSEALRLLPGMQCTLCLAAHRCAVCGARGRNRCGHCGRSLCRVHTQELCGSVVCGRCAR